MAGTPCRDWTLLDPWELFGFQKESKQQIPQDIESGVREEEKEDHRVLKEG